MIVVDSSVVVSAATDNQALGEWGRDILRRDVLAAPQLLPVEVLSALRRLELNGLLTSEVATLAATDALALPVMLYPPDTARMWEFRHTVTVQDSSYVALAEALGAPFATLDRKLVAAPGPACRFLTPDG